MGMNFSFLKACACPFFPSPCPYFLPSHAAFLILCTLCFFPGATLRNIMCVSENASVRGSFTLSELSPPSSLPRSAHCAVKKKDRAVLMFPRLKESGAPLSAVGHISDNRLQCVTSEQVNKSLQTVHSTHR